MEKALLISIDVSKTIKKKDQAEAEALGELNRYLSNGWHVKEIRPSSGTDHFMSCCVAIIAKDGD